MKLIEGWVNRTIENSNLRRAFFLRRDGHLEESHAALEAACREGDGKALYLKARALFTGGWMYERDYRLSEICTRALFDFRCEWWPEFDWTFNHNKDVDSFKQGLADGHFLFYAYCISPSPIGSSFPQNLDAANFGDERSQYRVGRAYKESNPKLAFEYFLKGAQQKHKDCMYKVARYYEKGKGCKQDLLKAAEYFVQGRFQVQIPDRLSLAYWNQHWEVVYIYAHACIKDRQLYYMLEGSQECMDAVDMYRNTITKAKEAVFCFTLICRQYGFLSRDIRKLVGQKIWESRKNLGLWSKKVLHCLPEKKNKK